MPTKREIRGVVEVGSCKGRRKDLLSFFFLRMERECAPIMAGLQPECVHHQEQPKMLVGRAGGVGRPGMTTCNDGPP